MKLKRWMRSLALIMVLSSFGGLWKLVMPKLNHGLNLGGACKEQSQTRRTKFYTQFSQRSSLLCWILAAAQVGFQISGVNMFPTRLPANE